LETASNLVTLQQVKDSNFGQTNLLAATWDTLGWVLFQEGKNAEAEKFLRAAWLNRPDLEVGSHLAQVLEALGNRSEAQTMNELALACDGSANNPAESAKVMRNLERLRQAGAETAPQTQATMRAFHIPKPAGVRGSATFRVSIKGQSIEQSDLVDGTPELRALSSELNGLKMTGVLPPGSGARLFHDGVLDCSSSAPTCDFLFVSHFSRTAVVTQ
jgi:tetratricopeptide (TPR) repeat protein